MHAASGWINRHPMLETGKESRKCDRSYGWQPLPLGVFWGTCCWRKPLIPPWLSHGGPRRIRMREPFGYPTRERPLGRRDEKASNGGTSITRTGGGITRRGINGCTATVRQNAGCISTRLVRRLADIRRTVQTNPAITRLGRCRDGTRSSRQRISVLPLVRRFTIAGYLHRKLCLAPLAAASAREVRGLTPLWKSASGHLLRLARCPTSRY